MCTGPFCAAVSLDVRFLLKWRGFLVTRINAVASPRHVRLFAVVMWRDDSLRTAVKLLRAKKKCMVNRNQ